jgi:hypothetical protein
MSVIVPRFVPSTKIEAPIISACVFLSFTLPIITPVCCAVVQAKTSMVSRMVVNFLFIRILFRYFNAKIEKIF